MTTNDATNAGTVAQRVERSIEDAVTALWRAIEAHFPEVVTTNTDPDADELTEALERAVNWWLRHNHPSNQPRPMAGDSHPRT